MAKKRVTVSIEESLITQLDKITTNRSAFMQALVEGALAGFKTFLVPEGYKPPTFGHAPPPPPPPSATEEERRKWDDAYASAQEKKKRKFALTPEQIAYKGTLTGITNELEQVFAKARARSDESASSALGMRKDQLRIFAALKGEGEEE